MGDAEQTALQNMRKKEHFAQKLKQVFEEADDSGDGQINAAEFKHMLSLVHVGTIFRELDLEVCEVVALFHLVADDDGAANYEEFLDGALKMKSSARTIDVITILHEQTKLSKKIDQNTEHLEYLKALDRNMYKASLSAA